MIAFLKTPGSNLLEAFACPFLWEVGEESVGGVGEGW